MELQPLSLIYMHSLPTPYLSSPEKGDVLVWLSELFRLFPGELRLLWGDWERLWGDVRVLGNFGWSGEVGLIVRFNGCMADFLFVSVLLATSANSGSSVNSAT